MRRLDSAAATRETLALCHGASYLDLVESEIGAGRRMLSTGDTHVGPQSLEAARAAAGAVCAAVDAVAAGEVEQAFCALRPPGHHARPAQGMGFCVFNNVAVAARHAMRRHGLERVLIADWDVHHGNGTQDIFYRDPDVLFFSTHQSPWYPGTGAAGETGDGAGAGTTINCPFPSGSGRSEVLGAFRDLLLPAAEAFRPDLVMVSAGFDSRLGDPLGQFRLLDEDFREMTLLLRGGGRAARGRTPRLRAGRRLQPEGPRRRRGQPRRGPARVGVRARRAPSVHADGDDPRRGDRRVARVLELQVHAATDERHLQHGAAPARPAHGHRDGIGAEQRMARNPDLPLPDPQLVMPVGGLDQHATALPEGRETQAALDFRPHDVPADLFRESAQRGAQARSRPAGSLRPA